MMNGSSIAFYCIAAFVLVTALLAVTTTKIFRAAIWLLFSLIGIAGFYFWMQVEFVAAVQIIVYVGGIVVLIIFSIFLTQQNQSMPVPAKGRVIFASLASIFGLAFTINLIAHHSFAARTSQVLDTSPTAIGTAMLSTGSNGFVLPFEVISILLLSAMIGCIVIAIKVTPVIKHEPGPLLNIGKLVEPNVPTPGDIRQPEFEKEEVNP